MAEVSTEMTLCIDPGTVKPEGSTLIELTTGLTIVTWSFLHPHWSEKFESSVGSRS
jgi:hypothetical protein